MVRGVAASALAAGALGLAPGVADRNAAGPQVVRSADGLPTLSIPAGAPPPKPRLVTGCAMVTHTALGGFPSFLDFVLGFDPKSLPASPTATLHATGINDDQPVSGPVDATTGKADLKAGIRNFGTYSVGTVTVNGVAVDVSSIFGTLTVTATPGTIAGTCP